MPIITALVKTEGGTTWCLKGRHRQARPRGPRNNPNPRPARLMRNAEPWPLLRSWVTRLVPVWSVGPLGNGINKTEVMGNRVLSRRFTMMQDGLECVGMRGGPIRTASILTRMYLTLSH